MRKRNRLRKEKIETTEIPHERYFIVSYVGVLSSGRKHKAEIGYMTTNNSFLNRRATVRTIKEDNLDITGEVTILNIIELNENDYNRWWE